MFRMAIKKKIIKEEVYKFKAAYKYRTIYLTLEFIKYG
jgi:hypothetical protein